jgi:CubicO group peptidase (beta-lactamase class C family)
MSGEEMRLQLSEGKLDGLFRDLDHGHMPGAVVGVAVQGVPVYRRGYGLASMELPVVLSPSIRLRIGSITKHFTALAYLLLSETGRCSVDDTVGKYLPELSPVVRAAKIYQLMGNISGLRDAHDIRWQFSGVERTVTSTEILAQYRAIKDVAFAPGASWSYNNGNWLLLTAVIERLTGRPLEATLSELILKPAGLHDTQLRRYDTDFMPSSATLHTPTADHGFRKMNLGSELAGEGGLISTVDDMLRWLKHLDAPAFGRPSTWEFLKRPMVLANGTCSYYACGLIHDCYRGLDTLQHPGGVLGGSAHILKVPKLALDVVVLTNRGDMSAVHLADRILDNCVTGLKPAMRPPEMKATGVYRSSRTGRIVQLSEQGDEQIIAIDGVEMPAREDSNGVLWVEGRWFGYTNRVTCAKFIGDRQTPTRIELLEFGNADELERLPQPEFDEAVTRLGEYRSESIATQATISAIEGTVQLTTVGRFGCATYQLEPIASNIWRARQRTAMLWGGILAFDLPAGGFRFSGYTNRLLPFERVR